MIDLVKSCCSRCLVLFWSLFSAFQKKKKAGKVIQCAQEVLKSNVETTFILTIWTTEFGAACNEDNTIISNKRRREVLSMVHLTSKFSEQAEAPSPVYKKDKGSSSHGIAKAHSFCFFLMCCFPKTTRFCFLPLKGVARGGVQLWHFLE